MGAATVVPYGKLYVYLVLLYTHVRVRVTLSRTRYTESRGGSHMERTERSLVSHSLRYTREKPPAPMALRKRKTAAGAGMAGGKGERKSDSAPTGQAVRDGDQGVGKEGQKTRVDHGKRVEGAVGGVDRTAAAPQDGKARPASTPSAPLPTSTESVSQTLTATSVKDVRQAVPTQMPIGSGFTECCSDPSRCLCYASAAYQASRQRAMAFLWIPTFAPPSQT